MKTLIVYSSNSGNTRKLAEAIHANLPGEHVMQTIDEKPDVEGFDLVCVGFWFKGGKADAKVTDFLKRINNAQPVFLFATHGAAADSEHAVHGLDSTRNIMSSNPYVSTFSCQGEVKADFLEKAKRMDPIPPWIADAEYAVGHPDRADIQRLERVLEKMVEYHQTVKQ